MISQEHQQMTPSHRVQRRLTISKDDPFTDIFLSSNKKKTQLRSKTVNNTDLEEILQDDPLVVEEFNYFPDFDGTQDSTAYKNQLKLSPIDETNSTSSGSNNSNNGENEEQKDIPKHAPWKNK